MTDDDEGAPPHDPRVRVHTFADDGTAISSPIDATRLADQQKQLERARRNREAEGAPPKGAPRAKRSVEAAPGLPADSFAAELVKKYPPFDVAWSDDIKAKWFDGFEKLMSMGAKE